MTHKDTDRQTQDDSRGDDFISSEHRVERAAGEFRRGCPVFVRAAHAKDSALGIAAETVNDRTLAALRDLFAAPAVIITHARASTLKIPLYTQEVVCISQQFHLTARDVRALADPTTDLDYPLKGPFEAARTQPSDAARASVRLAKFAGLLPATAIFPADEKARERVLLEMGIVEVSVADIMNYKDQVARSLELVTRASIPLAGAGEAEFAAFRPKNGGQEHYAVLIGASDSPKLQPPGPVLTRLHSECFTGDFLGSLKCDCGDQLRGAVAAIAAEGGGVLLYLAQEGRGIGLMNKLRAYRLQDEGFDTMEANRRLGFAADERLYDIAARMLILLGYKEVRLMTNNPDKVRALEQAGVKVVERVPHSFPDNVHNRDYLRAKAEKGGHLL